MTRVIVCDRLIMVNFSSDGTTKVHVVYSSVKTKLLFTHSLCISHRPYKLYILKGIEHLKILKIPTCNTLKTTTFLLTVKFTNIFVKNMTKNIN